MAKTKPAAKKKPAAKQKPAAKKKPTVKARPKVKAKPAAKKKPEVKAKAAGKKAPAKPVVKVTGTKRSEFQLQLLEIPDMGTMTIGDQKALTFPMKKREKFFTGI